MFFMCGRPCTSFRGAISVIRQPTKTLTAMRSSSGSAADAGRPRARRAASNRFQSQIRTRGTILGQDIVDTYLL